MGVEGGIGVSGSGCNEVLALEVLHVVDCVKRRRRVEPPASVSVPRADAAASSFQACLHECMCTCCGLGAKLHQTTVLYTSADKHIYGDRCC